MVIRIASVLTYLLLAIAASAFGEEPRHVLTVAEEFQLQSEALSEERLFWVHLPPSYHEALSAQRRYPVIYLLDGETHLHVSAGIVEFMSAGTYGNNFQIPESIIVAIPNTVRLRDLTPTHSLQGPTGEVMPWYSVSGGANAFMEFLRNELIPKIDEDYRTLRHRTVVGHSLAGLFTLHALIQAPELFQGYIALDPSLWWDDSVLLQTPREALLEAASEVEAVYIALADNPDIGIAGSPAHEDAVTDFSQLLSTVEDARLRTRLQHFEDEDHLSVPLQGLYHGLLHVFEGYNPPLAEIVARPEFLRDHFERIAERLRVDLSPPPVFLGQLGSIFLYDRGDAGSAIRVFEYYADVYPMSSYAHFGLGEAHRANSNYPAAIGSFETALVLGHPDDGGYIEEQLETLRSRVER